MDHNTSTGLEPSASADVNQCRFTDTDEATPAEHLALGSWIPESTSTKGCLRIQNGSVPDTMATINSGFKIRDQFWKTGPKCHIPPEGAEICNSCRVTLFTKEILTYSPCKGHDWQGPCAV